MYFRERIKDLYWGGFSAQVFSENSAAIASSNLKSAKAASTYAVVLFFLLAVVSAFVEITPHFLWPWLASGMLMLVFRIALFLYAPKHPQCGLAFMYIGVGSIALFTACIGIRYSTHGSTAAVIALIAAIPSQILDRPGRVALFSLGITAFFCIGSLLFRDLDSALMNCVNALSVMVLGLGIAWHNIKVQVAGIINKSRLEWNESMYKAILQDTDDILFELDPERETLFFGEQGEAVFADTMDYHRFVNADCVHRADRARHIGMMDLLLRKQESAQGEIRLVNKDAEVLWFALRAVSLMRSDGSKRRVVGRLMNIDEQKRKEEMLRFKSEMDAMTGLYNKETTVAEIKCALDMETGTGALVLVDIDDLKQINDNLGHAEGDEAIRRLAATLKKSFGERDIVGRIGGDEFMAFFRCAEGSGELTDILSKLLAGLNAIALGEDRSQSLRVSMGVALCSQTCRNFQRLYRMADTALYRVKKTRKNGFAFFDPTIDLPVEAREYLRW